MAYLPLQGIRVLDMTVVWAGPYATQLLASLGAEVIRIESVKFFPPLTRGVTPRPSKEQIKQGQPPFNWGLPNREPGKHPWNRVPAFNAHAINKRSVTIDLTTDQGKDFLAQLVNISDLFVENNVTETLEKLGITYEWLKFHNQNIIMIRMPAFGNTGPYKNYRALGSMNESVAGHNTLRGYLGMTPAWLTPVYAADAAAGANAAFSALAALHYRKRTGKGQLIEVAQVESFLPYLSQALMDYSMNLRTQISLGNRHPFAVQGCYSCKNDDQADGGHWVVITLTTDQEFQRFCDVMDRPELVNDKRFSTVLSRYKNQDALDLLIGEWTIRKTHYEAFHALQAAGIAAGPVMDQQDVFADNHLNARAFFQKVTAQECGTHLYPKAAFTMSETPPTIRSEPCRLGADNEYVYKKLLNLTDSEYHQLEREGKIGTEYEEGIF